MDATDATVEMSRFVVVSVGFLTDGGTIRLHLLDERGEPHIVRLQQHAFPQSVNSDNLPGRLYIDDIEVPVRSPQEARLLDSLLTADVHSEWLRSTARNLIDDLIGFVASDEYLEFAAQVDAIRLGV